MIRVNNMIKSRIKNQEMAKRAIFDYLAEYPNFGEITATLELTRFVKFLAQRMLSRVENDDCYFVDMLEDLERIE